MDSGADSTVFPVEFAEELGISIDACRVLEFEAADHLGTEWVWHEPLTCTFDGQLVELPAAFTNSPLGIVLLGREDFFVHYRVTIDQRDQTFTLEQYDDDPSS